MVLIVFCKRDKNLKEITFTHWILSKVSKIFPHQIKEQNRISLFLRFF